MKYKFLVVFSFLLTCTTFCNSQTTIIDSIISNGIYRFYRLYVPKNYDNNKPYPLIFNLHGYTSNALKQQYYSNFMPIADTAQFLTVYPQGTTYKGITYWNASLDPTGANDVLFISNLIDSLALKYKIDLASVYSCGMSLGGFMSYTLACSLNHRVAAIASVGGTFFRQYFINCKPDRAIPTMEIHGTGDVIVPYNGNSSMLGIDTVVSYWVKNNECVSPAIFEQLPDINSNDKSTVEHYVYEAKQPHGSTCELYKIINGGHTWPGAPIILLPGQVMNQDFNASNKIWLFFRKYKLNITTGITQTKNLKSVSKIYPNPCIDILTVEGDKIKQLIIVDLTGRVILETTEKYLNISNFKKGVYSLRINYENNNYEIKKLVKL
ncbi:MAG: T9SS type A sorting domain-containing protein [Bacteroidia bacterium]